MTNKRRGLAYRLRTLPIRTKLALVSVIAMLALVSLPSLSLYQNSSIRAMNQTRLEIMSLDRMLLDLQRNQNDFVNLFELKYLDEFSTTFEEFVGRTEDLKEQFWNLGLPTDTLEQLVVLTSDYQYLFEVMAEQKILIGQDNASGIRKELKTNLKNIKTVLNTLPNQDTVRQTLLFRTAQLQLPVQNLLTRHQENQVVTIEKYVSIIIETSKKVADKNTQRAILDAIEAYHDTVHKLITATKTVGMTYDDGLNGKISTIVENSKKILARLKTQVNAAINLHEQRLNTMLGLFAFFFSLVFILTAIMLSRSISAPIRKVTSIMTQLADGDLDVNIPLEPRRDEIGDMLRALRVFKMGAVIRQRTQEALRTAHDNLEHRVDERTTELRNEINERSLTEKQLMLAREDAESANHAKSLFLANMSHELRTPLNAIIGYAEMLQEDAEDVNNKPLVNDLEKIHSAGRHLLEIISKILDLSKIEAGHIDIYVEEFSVQDVLVTVADMVKPLILNNNNTLEIKHDGNLGTMNSDITRLRQILFNFLSNAAKFTKNGTITLSAWRKDSVTSDTLMFSVADTGIGMTSDQLEHIFNPFTQADISTTRKYGGTGLGLTINREFARHLGGEISVESTIDKGTIFTVCLPAHAPCSTEGGETQ